MGLVLGDNFDYKSSKPLDARLKYDTLAAMKAVADATMYEGCMAYCEATGSTYQWKSSNTVDATTGKWREFESGGEDENAYHTTDSAGTAIADDDYFPFFDTSASGKKKSLWSNIKSVLKTYFDTLYSTVTTSKSASSGGTALSLVTTGEKYTWNNKQNALTAGTNIGISGNTISGTNTLSLNYSTNEQAIGKWTNNKTLYQKTIYLSTLAAKNTETYVELGISNVSQLVDSEVYYAFGDSNIFDIPYLMAHSYGYISPYCEYSGHKLLFAYKLTTALKDVYITVRYTKTT